MADIEYLTVEHLPTKDLIRIFSQIAIHDDLWFNGTPCWIWSGDRLAHNGYGRICYQAKATRIHRLMFAWLVHPIPKGQKHGEIDHLCRIVACCNPLHLDFVSGATNLLRGNGAPAKNAKKDSLYEGSSTERRQPFL